MASLLVIAALVACGYAGRLIIWLANGRPPLDWGLSLYHWQCALSTFFCATFLVLGSILAVRRCSDRASERCLQVLYGIGYVLACAAFGYTSILALGYVAKSLQALSGTEVHWEADKQHYILGCEFYLVLGLATHALRRARQRDEERRRAMGREELEAEDGVEGGRQDLENGAGAAAEAGGGGVGVDAVSCVWRGLMREWNFGVSLVVVWMFSLALIVAAGVLGMLGAAAVHGKPVNVQAHH